MPYIERNHEGYRDPTASLAFHNIEREEKAKRLGYMPLTYICSPYAGDIERNVQNARRYCAFALRQKALPIAPHLLFPQFMGAETAETRELASEGERSEPEVRGQREALRKHETPGAIGAHGAMQHMGLILLRHCKEVWYFGERISEGMRLELNKARLRGIPVRHFTDDCKEVPL